MELPSCRICGYALDDDVVNIGPKGRKTLQNVSETRQDGKFFPTDCDENISLHRKCRQTYTNERCIDAARKKVMNIKSVKATGMKDFSKFAESDYQNINKCVEAARNKDISECVQQEDVEFDYQKKCILCNKDASEEFIRKEMKKTQAKRNVVSVILRRETGDSILRKILCRSSLRECSMEIIKRVQGVDLVMVNARYHKNCYVKYLYNKKSCNSNPRRGRPISKVINDQMRNIYNYIDATKDKHQFSIEEIRAALKQDLPGDKTIERRLVERYGDNILTKEIEMRRETSEFSCALSKLECYKEEQDVSPKIIRKDIQHTTPIETSSGYGCASLKSGRKMKGRGLLMLEKVLSANEIEPARTEVQLDVQDTMTTPSLGDKTSEETLNNDNVELENNENLLLAPSTSTEVRPSYYISPVHSECSDLDDSDADPHFVLPTNEGSHLNRQKTTRFSRSPSSSSTSSSSSSSSSTSSSSSNSSTEMGNQSIIANGAIPDTATLQQNDPQPSTSQPIINEHTSTVTESLQRSRKRSINPDRWVLNVKKALRNTGKAYTTSTNKRVPNRAVKPPCTDKCKLKCKDKIAEPLRQTLFDNFWALGDLQKQREFIIRHTQYIKPKYRYSSTQNLRSLNSAFFFEVGGSLIRVCKMFFKCTLNISDQCIRTALTKQKEGGFLEDEQRGKHGHHKTIDTEVKDSVFTFIKSIPRIESHYLRAQTTREYITSEKSLADLYRDYKDQRENDNLPFASSSTFNRIFNTQFNISFHIPKKDACDLCETYNNSSGEAKQNLHEAYEQHLKEKVLSRSEKEADKKRTDVDVAVYDLQAVMQVPKGQASLFFYKSRINCLNFTISDLYAKDVYCYFWDEIEGKRGAVEIGSCVLQYIQMLVEKNSSDTDLDIMFYSDNCCGQQKNKYLLSAYAFAVSTMRVNSITHKFLIRGHSQNEGDNVHSVIEKQIKRFTKAGSIYTPQQYATLIGSAKKTGKPYHVKELTHDKFYDLKALQEEWGNNFTVNSDRQQIKWHDIKQLRVEKYQQMIFFYKTSYEDTVFKKAFVRNLRRAQDHQFSPTLKQAYLQKIPLGANKKRDIKELIDKKIIPERYVDSYFKKALDIE